MPDWEMESHGRLLYEQSNMLGARRLGKSGTG